MSSVVLDASAILAIICKEQGAAVVAEQSQGAFVSAVNLAEVYSKILDVGFKLEELQWAISALQLVPVPLSHELAMLTGSLRESTRGLGLSLGDRACLAVALDQGLTVVTADKKWKELKLGVSIRTIR